MILDHFDNIKLSPKEWEELCDSCYSIRYPGKWHKTPAAYLGDCGIEGFTDNGIVYQCYYPEQTYANDELYDHQRDKLTTDLAKILNPKYIPKLRRILGRIIIKQWHLVVPEYKDTRIVEHANKKESDVLAEIQKDPTKYPHIDPSIRISVMTANCFVEEISKTIRSQNRKIKLQLQLNNEINYSSCEVDKVENIKRKIIAIQPEMSDAKINKLVDAFIKHYLEGVAKLNNLRINLPTEYAELHDLLSAYKTEVELKTSLNAAKSLNKTIFDGIMNDFQTALERLGIFNQSTILNLKYEIISGWLADCSMEFIA